ncbi:hypothetical protein HYFRA_00006079 [Hymenoscyphus fraxineus]|uniref:DNA repair protein RAD16 n=1 Tax=Hymenoscyphus fraxineus TaxID=746836 RepID=A0A9N9KWN5_9HELO|nr:hypothetical protein HYFRA_00006079 [Hymenoscyphus fraxineus]
MAPRVASRQRGRPKNPTQEAAVPSKQASTGTRRSLRNASQIDLSIANTPKQGSVAPTNNGDDVSSTSEFPTLEMLTSTKKTQRPNDRSSSSSLSASRDYNDSSGYSTPLTSAVATPATLPQEATSSSAGPSKTGRGRRTKTPVSTSGVSMVAKAAALRNSQYSLASKRKRVPDSEEEDAEDDNTADAQLARALQEKEDAAASSMAMDIDTVPTISKASARQNPRGRKKLQKVRPAAPEVILSSKGSNDVSFTSKKSTKKIETIVLDSDSDDLTIPDESDYLSTDDELAVSKFFRKKQPTKLSGPRRGGLTAPARPGPARLGAQFTKFRSAQRELLSPSPLSDLTPVSTGNVSDTDSDLLDPSSMDSDDFDSDDSIIPMRPRVQNARHRINLAEDRGTRRGRLERKRLESHHPVLHTMWKDLENLPKIGDVKIVQPMNINRELKPFQLQGVGWMKAMEKTAWGGGLLGDEMGMGKTIQAVSLIMSDFPAKLPSLVLIPPVALMQWQQEIESYTDGTLKTFVYHGTNNKTKAITKAELEKYNVILMSYNSLESMYRRQVKGAMSKGQLKKQASVIHQIHFHRVILDEAHNIKTRTTGSAKACFALNANHKWCLSGTPLQNRIGEFFSLVRFLNIQPFACYFCKQCDCEHLNWEMNEDNRCEHCGHSGMQHVSVFNQELLTPIQKFGNNGPGQEAFRKLRILTDRFMLRRVKRDHSSAMELPAKEIYVDRQFFGEEENDFAGSIMNSGTRKFETYVAQGVLLNNYANIFGLIMQMRQVADHPDLILKKNGEGGQNILVCCICDETAEEAIRSTCKHDFCRECVKSYLRSSDEPDCPQCHIPLSIDLEQPEIEQDEQQVKKSSIINRIKMENWTSSSKIETLVHDLWKLRKPNRTTKSIIFSQFTTMLQLVEWRLRRAGITTVMLDGSMTPAQRQASINHFMTDVNVECFLVSLKAGGVALNLTEASHVFIVDPWWNPAAEWQSADRCHRIGQARPCSITRLCIEDSVESRMVLLQEKKANMINSTINSDDAAMQNLSPEDMQFLFRGS